MTSGGRAHKAPLAKKVRWLFTGHGRPPRHQFYTPVSKAWLLHPNLGRFLHERGFSRVEGAVVPTWIRERCDGMASVVRRTVIAAPTPYLRDLAMRTQTIGSFNVNDMDPDMTAERWLQEYPRYARSRHEQHVVLPETFPFQVMNRRDFVALPFGPAINDILPINGIGVINALGGGDIKRRPMTIVDASPTEGFETLFPESPRGTESGRMCRCRWHMRLPHMPRRARYNLYLHTDRSGHLPPVVVVELDHLTPRRGAVFVRQGTQWTSEGANEILQEYELGSNHAAPPNLVERAKRFVNEYVHPLPEVPYVIAYHSSHGLSLAVNQRLTANSRENGIRNRFHQDNWHYPA